MHFIARDAYREHFLLEMLLALVFVVSQASRDVELTERSTTFFEKEKGIAAFSGDFG